MSIFTRLSDIINANLHSLLDKAEEPEKMINFVIQEMEEALVDVRTTSVKYLAEKKTIERLIAAKQKRAEQWQAKAEIAIEKARDDLAKAALQSKHALQPEIENHQEELAEIDRHIAQVQEDASRLQEKLTEAKARQKVLLLRQDVASSRLKFKEKQSTYDIDAAILKFEQYEKKVEQLEAELQAYELTEVKDLNREIEQLARDSAIEEELNALKTKLAS